MATHALGSSRRRNGAARCRIGLASPRDNARAFSSGATMQNAVLVRPLSALMSLAACIAAASVSAPLMAQVMMFDSAQPISPQEETARFLPGIFYFKKGLDYHKKRQM